MNTINYATRNRDGKSPNSVPPITKEIFDTWGPGDTVAEAAIISKCIKKAYADSTEVLKTNIRDLIAVMNIAAHAVGKAIDIEASYLNKILAPRTKDKGRDFTMPYESMLKLCSLYLHCTISELMTGAKWTVKATRRLSYYVLVRDALDEETRASLDDYTNELLLSQEEMPQAGTTIIAERLQELAADEGELYQDMMSKYCKNNNTLVAFKALMSGLRNEAREVTVLHLCCSANISPDYLLVRDYIESDILMTNGKHMARNQKKYASKFLQLSKENQDKIISRLIYANVSDSICV